MCAVCQDDTAEMANLLSHEGQCIQASSLRVHHAKPHWKVRTVNVWVISVMFVGLGEERRLPSSCGWRRLELRSSCLWPFGADSANDFKAGFKGIYCLCRTGSLRYKTDSFKFWYTVKYNS